MSYQRSNGEWVSASGGYGQGQGGAWGGSSGGGGNALIRPRERFQGTNFFYFVLLHLFHSSCLDFILQK